LLEASAMKSGPDVMFISHSLAFNGF
jgi:hypothetical protein